MTNFEKALREWLKKNNFNCDITFEDDFGYEWDTNILHIGVLGYENVGRWFEQFLYEYGMDYVGIYDPVLALIHELGHYSSLGDFEPEELMLLGFIKDLDNERMSNQEFMNEYWELPDEFAANMWAINFVNENIEAVEDLCNIYLYYWDEFINERNVA